jgi:hypothetical protein
MVATFLCICMSQIETPSHLRKHVMPCTRCNRRQRISRSYFVILLTVVLEVGVFISIALGLVGLVPDQVQLDDDPGLRKKDLVALFLTDTL